MNARFAILIALLCAGVLSEASHVSAQTRKMRHTHKPQPDTSAATSGDDLGDVGEQPNAEDKQPSGDKPDTSDAPPAASENQSEANSESPPSQEVAAPTDAATTVAPEGGPDLLADPFIGMGIGSRYFRRPTMQGGQIFNEQPFTAVDVGIDFRVFSEHAFSWIFLARYQTSLGLVSKETPPFALPNKVDVRADRVELSAAPTLRLGESATAPRVSIPIGGQLRTFWPTVHNLQTPRYVMVGPFARTELQFFLTDSLWLRVGPEFEWIARFSAHLTNNGVKTQGIALGAEASLHLALSSVFALELNYRQATSMADVSYGPTFRDVERFLTARLFGTM